MLFIFNKFRNNQVENSLLKERKYDNASFDICLELHQHAMTQSEQIQPKRKLARKRSQWCRENQVVSG